MSSGGAGASHRPDAMKNVPSTASSDNQPRVRRLTPPVWLWLAAIAPLAAIFWIRRPDGIDNAIANILTLVCVFLSCMTLLVWFCAFSGYRRRVRLAPAIVLPLLIASAFAVW